MTTKDDFFGTEKLGTEKVEVSGVIEPGPYQSCIGKVYRDTTKNGFGRVVVDFILIQRGGTKPFPILTQKKLDGGIIHIELQKNKAGKSATEGVIFGASFFDIRPDANSGQKYYAKADRKMFACGLNVYSEAMEEIDWDKVKSLAGSICGIEIVKDFKGKYNQLKYDAVGIIPGVKVPVEDLIAIYDEIEKQEREAAEAEAGGPSPEEPPF